MEQNFLGVSYEGNKYTNPRISGFLRVSYEVGKKFRMNERRFVGGGGGQQIGYQFLLLPLPRSP